MRNIMTWYHGKQKADVWNKNYIMDCTEESRKDETCLQFKMNKYFIKTRKICQNMCKRNSLSGLVTCIYFFRINYFLYIFALKNVNAKSTFMQNIHLIFYIYVILTHKLVLYFFFKWKKKLHFFIILLFIHLCNINSLAGFVFFFIN